SPSSSPAFSVCRRSKRRANDSFDYNTAAGKDLGGSTDHPVSKRRSPTPVVGNADENKTEDVLAHSSISSDALCVTTAPCSSLNDNPPQLIVDTNPATPGLSPCHLSSLTPTCVSSTSKGSERPIVPVEASLKSSLSTASTASTASTGSSINRKPLQFINSLAPVVPRPKPLSSNIDGSCEYVPTDSAKQQKARKQQREEGKIKRTPNCFIIFRTRMHPMIAAQYGNLNNKEVSKIAGQLWADVPEEIKAQYKSLAKEEKRKHESFFPSYKYSSVNPRPPKKNDAAVLKDEPCTSTSSKSSPVSIDSVTLAPSTTTDEVEYDRESRTSVSPLAELGNTDETISPTMPLKSSCSKKKAAQERKYVVTEVALHEFTGDSNLSAKRALSFKTRPSTATSALSPRLQKSESNDALDKMDIESSLSAVAAAKVDWNSLPSSKSNLSSQKEFTFVPALVSCPPSLASFQGHHFQQEQQLHQQQNYLVPVQSYPLLTFAPQATGDLRHRASISGNATQIHSEWGNGLTSAIACPDSLSHLNHLGSSMMNTAEPLDWDMLPTTLDMSLDFELALQDLADTSTRLGVESGDGLGTKIQHQQQQQQREQDSELFSLPMPLDSLRSAAAATDFQSLQRQQERHLTSPFFQTPTSCSQENSLDQGFPWDLGMVATTTTESPGPDSFLDGRYDSPATTPIGRAASMLAIPSMMTISPLPLLQTPIHLLASTMSIEHNKHSSHAASTSATAGSLFALETPSAMSAGPVHSQVLNSDTLAGYTQLAKGQAQTATSAPGEWPSLVHSAQYHFAPSPVLPAIPLAAERNSIYTMASGLWSPPLSIVLSDAACSSSAGPPSNSVEPTQDFATGWTIPEGFQRPQKMTSFMFNAPAPFHHHHHYHHQVPLEKQQEKNAENCTDEQLSMSIEYYEKVLELQKIRLTAQRQMKQKYQQQQQQYYQQHYRAIGAERFE
ncbi:hypothetical protein BGZ99_005818, partial [Dissophora globulifera]